MTEKKIKHIYTRELLNDILKRDNARLVSNNDTITSKSIVEFICNCGNQYKKSFVVCVQNKMCCRQCMNKIMVEKTKKHNLETFGCEDPNQLPTIKEKIKNTFKLKYGTDSPMKTDMIKQKQKDICLKKYGVENPFQSNDIKKKITETLQQKYGVKHPLQYQIFKDKFKETCLENHNVEIPYKSDSIKLKGKETCLKRYGVEYSLQSPEIREKIKQTNLQRYGVENITQNNDIKEKIKKTCLLKYGVENVSQNISILEKQQKNSKKRKEYKMPSGTIRYVQGYEPFALKLLLLEYNESDIITSTKDIPRIVYKDEYNKQHYYFPDIYIPSINKIIEVKSEYTFLCEYDTIQIKSEATKNEGYIYEIWIFNKKGELIHKE